MQTLSQREEIQLNKKGALYWSADHDLCAVCTVSKRYEKKVALLTGMGTTQSGGNCFPRVKDLFSYWDAWIEILDTRFRLGRSKKC